MEFNHTADNEKTNSSVHEELTTIFKALGIVHLIIVVIPTIILAPVVIYYLCMLMKASGVKSVSLLFLFLAILCMLSPLSYGVLLDVSLISAIPLFGNCITQYPVIGIQFMIVFGLAMAVSVTVATIAVLQFMVLQCRGAVMLKYVIVVYAGLLVACFSASGIFFNGEYIEIYGSYCKGSSGPVNLVVCAALAFIVPVLLTVIFSILTCIKVKRDVSSQMNSAVRSVVATNAFNIITYLALRLGSLLVYFIVVSINPTMYTVYMLTVMARYIGELNYPLTLLSILIVHSGVRRKIFMKIKPATHGVVVSMENITEDMQH